MCFELYGCRYVQNRANCRYPIRMVIRSPADICRAVGHDFVCARYKDNYRMNDNFESADVAFWDVDNSGTDDPGKWITPEKIGELFSDVAFAITPSRHNMIPKGNESARPRFHVFAPIRAETSFRKYGELKARVQRSFSFFDPNAVDAARFVYGCKVRQEEVIWHEGKLTIDQFIENWERIHGCLSPATKTFNMPSSENVTTGNATSGKEMPRAGSFPGQQRTSSSEPYVIPEGSRNATLSRYAARVIKRFGDGERAKQLYRKEAARCRPPLSDQELDSIWKSACRFGTKIFSDEDYVSPEQYGADDFDDIGKEEPSNGLTQGKGPPGRAGSVGEASSKPPEKPPAGSLKPEDYTDLGQARVLSREYGEELRYSPALDYMRYDGTQWRESGELAVGAEVELTDLQMADADLLMSKTKKALLDSGASMEEAAEAVKKMKKGMKTGLSEKQMKLYEDYLDAKTYQSFVLDRRNWKYLKAALDTCRPLVQIDVHDFDKNEFLLNTPSATYDLRKGLEGRREHRPRDFITKSTSVDPGEQGKELWLDALDKIFLGDQELIDYVQRVVGLAAIGKVYIEALIISYGAGRNGKSTFWNTILHVLGSYSGRLSADTLTVGCRRNIKPELAEVFGKRLVIAAELEEGQRLNTSIIKQLCSTDDLFVEKKYKAPFSFTPTHTVILYTNHLPRVGATDDGIWRRLIVIPFRAKFEGKSDTKNYGDQLQKCAGPAVLSWIIEGARKVIDSNFRITEPEIVRDSISDYREQNDWLTQFLTACCELTDNPYAEAPSGELYQKYRDYSLKMGEYTRSTADFYAALDNKGFAKHRTGNGRFIRGLRIRQDDSSNPFESG
jgi:putative DNA primase/helicase